MRIVVPCGIEETKRRIRYGVHLESGPVGFCMPLALNAEIRGNVKENTFWAQKTVPHIMNLPQRYFRGTLEECDGQTIVEGRFQHTGLTKGSVLAIFAWFFFGAVETQSLLPLLFLLPFLFLMLALSSIWYEREEQAVIDFLRRL